MVGGAVGAGFISGAELVRFFHTRSFFFPVLLSAALFFLQCALFLRLGRRYGGYENTLRALFGRGAAAVGAAVSLLCLIPCAGMLAGLDALLPSAAPLLSAGGLLLTALLLTRGTKGISILNLILVPVLLVFVFAFGGGQPHDFLPTAAEGISPFGGGALYAGMNAFLLAPVLLDIGREIEKPLLSSAVAALVIAAASFAIMGSIYRAGGEALQAEMPFLYVMRGRKAFSCMVAIAIMTSLASSLYPPLKACEKLAGIKKFAAKAGVLFAAFALSRLGLSGIVGYFYPIEGGLGLALSVFGVLHEQFFKKRHEKVHSRRKDAEDDRRAHHEIELEHLPAVHDEVPKSRP